MHKTFHAHFWSFDRTSNNHIINNLLFLQVLSDWTIPDEWLFLATDSMFKDSLRAEEGQQVLLWVGLLCGPYKGTSPWSLGGANFTSFHCLRKNPLFSLALPAWLLDKWVFGLPPQLFNESQFHVVLIYFIICMIFCKPLQDAYIVLHDLM